MSGPWLPEDFDGIVRLFPLPDLVLFPHVVQPLRIFESRYLSLLDEALSSDQLITMALLSPGWQADYLGRPPIYPTVCIGRIISHERQADGTYHVLLAGVVRALILHESSTDLPFRTAEVRVLFDQGHEALNDQRAQQLRVALLDAYRMLDVDPDGAASTGLQQLVNGELPLGMLTDVLAYSLPLPVGEKQALLEMESVERRAARLIAHVADMANTLDRQFPPEFSDN